jgi:hypothetical protein
VISPLAKKYRRTLMVTDMLLGMTAIAVGGVVHYVRQIMAGPDPHIPGVMSQIEELRRDAGARGAPMAHTTDEQLQRLLTHTGDDVEITAIALAMKPRPEWVRDVMWATAA